MADKQGDNPDKRHWFYTLRSKLTMMAVSVVLFPMLLVTITAIYSQKEQIDRSLTRELNAGLGTCNLFFRGLEKQIKMANMATASDNACKTTLRLGVIPQLQNEVDKLGRKYQLDFLVVTDSTGNVKALYPKMSGSQENLSDHPMVRTALQGKSRTATHQEEAMLLNQDVTGTEERAARPRVLFLESAMPIMVRDQIIGSTVVGLRLTGNDGLLRDMKKASGIDKTILIAGNEVIAASFESDNHFNNPILETLAIELNNGKNKPETPSVVIDCNQHGRQAIKWQTINDLTGKQVAVLVAALNYDRANVLIKAAVRRILSIFLFCMLLATAITFVVARSIAKPVNDLSHAMHKIETGAPAETVPVQQNDEIGTLVQGFNNMAIQLQSHLEKLNQEIADRMHAETLLSAEKERLAVTLASIGDAVITTDVNGRVVFINKVGEELTGWNTEAASERPIDEIFHLVNEKTGELCSSPVEKVMECGRITALNANSALVARDGHRISIADSGAPIRDLDGKTIGVVIVFRDISHEKKLENELLKIQKLESIGVLAGGIAHDFNNILAAILGSIELVSHRLSDADQETINLLTHAQKATRRAEGLTNQLLTFSKGGAPIKDSTSLPGLIRESADFTLHGSQVTCDYLFPTDLWKVNVDSGQISQVIQNIILNAKEALPDGGKITIQAQNIDDPSAEPLLEATEGQYVRIVIQDTGSGIPKELIDKVFDPYFSTKKQGSGLGLAISHSIIRKHEGYLTVRSKQDADTAFSIYLPAIVTESTGETELKAGLPDSRSKRIMIMDDEEMLLDIAKAQLTALGHEPTLVADGEEALQVYRKAQEAGRPIDLVIMDLTIPGRMGGKEAAARLLEMYPDARLIVASGYSNDPVMSNYRHYGFQMAMTKPFDLDTLDKTIEQALA